ncbi:MAG: RNA polymerase sigma factor [Kofleriaceae bacterium]
MGPWDPLSDEELLACWRDGDGASGQVLIRRHHRTLSRFFANKVPSAVAPDLVQESFKRCMKPSAEVSSVRAYLLGIAFHVWIDHLRARQRERRLQRELEQHSAEELGVPPDQVLAGKVERRLLLRALRRLPMEMQVALELAYWERLSRTEIAEVMGRPPGTVATWLRAGKQALRADLARLARSTAQLTSTLDTLDQWSARVRATTHSEDVAPS